MAEDVIMDVIAPSYLWLTMAAEALVMQGQSAERVAIIDRPGEGILKVRRWMVGAEEACVDAIGMNADNFQRLCDSLEELGLVRNTARLPTYLRVALVLYMMRKAATYSTLRDVFQVSSASLSVIVGEVLDALVDPSFYNTWVQQPTLTTIPRDHDRYTNPKTKELTTQCLGALDGTHIPACPPEWEAAAHRNRKGFLSFNVLCCVTFDGLASYVYAGWEGSAHDQRVMNAALQEGGMRIPDGWYYLGDAGYALTPGVLTPHRNVRPATIKELFNLRHSSCRNVVERFYSRLKRKFRILTTGSPLPMDRQVNAIYACCALLNFMTRQGEPIDVDANVLLDGVNPINGALEIGDRRVRRPEDPAEGEGDLEDAAYYEVDAYLDSVDMKQKRELIGRQMWNQYRAYTRSTRRNAPKGRGQARRNR